MAKKAATRRQRSAPKRPVLSRFQGNLKRLQRDVEAVLSRTRKQAGQLVSRDQKQALNRLVSQAQRLRADFEKRVKQASRTLESRTDRFATTLEKEARKRLGVILERLVRQLNLPSRAEVHRLAQRIRKLERRAARHRPPTAQVPPPSPSEMAAPSPE